MNKEKHHRCLSSNIFQGSVSSHATSGASSHSYLQGQDEFWEMHIILIIGHLLIYSSARLRFVPGRWRFGNRQLPCGNASCRLIIGNVLKVPLLLTYEWWSKQECRCIRSTLSSSMSLLKLIRTLGWSKRCIFLVVTEKGKVYLYNLTLH